MPAIQWVSPLEKHHFREAADAAFLRALGLDRYVRELRGFWPQGGPNWDALGILGNSAAHDGVLLVEGKSYPDEVYGMEDGENLTHLGVVIVEALSYS